MRRWKLLPALLLVALPASGQSGKSKYRADHLCRAALSDGIHYEAWYRVLVTEGKVQPPYVGVRAYYRPGSGEFLWNSSDYSKVWFENGLKENSKKSLASCDDPNHHILLLRDGEWVDFWAFNSRIEVFHSNLRLATREKAWSHVAEHWQDASFSGGPLTKWVEEILLNKQLGNAFFRPKRLEFDARPFLFDPLVNAKKVGSHWEIEIKGADEPNRATVSLDSNFKLIAVTRNPVAH
jgi:hypothetical protein